jgi:hypothetical protein
MNAEKRKTKSTHIATSVDGNARLPTFIVPHTHTHARTKVCAYDKARYRENEPAIDGRPEQQSGGSLLRDASPVQQQGESRHDGYACKQLPYHNADVVIHVILLSSHTPLHCPHFFWQIRDFKFQETMAVPLVVWRM